MLYGYAPAWVLMAVAQPPVEAQASAVRLDGEHGLQVQPRQARGLRALFDWGNP